MRQTHVGGDKLFVDYAGDAVPVIIDRLWAWCAAPICRAGKQPCAATLADTARGHFRTKWRILCAARFAAILNPISKVAGSSHRVTTTIP